MLDPAVLKIRAQKHYWNEMEGSSPRVVDRGADCAQVGIAYSKARRFVIENWTETKAGVCQRRRHINLFESGCESYHVESNLTYGSCSNKVGRGLQEELQELWARVELEELRRMHPLFQPPKGSSRDVAKHRGYGPHINARSCRSAHRWTNSWQSEAALC